MQHRLLDRNISHFYREIEIFGVAEEINLVKLMLSYLINFALVEELSFVPVCTNFGASIIFC